jgi:hypothetical protein
MDTPWVFSKEFSYMLMAPLVSHLDIMSDRVRRRNFEVGMSSGEEVDELRIGDDCHRAIAFSYPLSNEGAGIHEPNKSIIRIMLTKTQG